MSTDDLSRRYTDLFYRSKAFYGKSFTTFWLCKTLVFSKGSELIVSDIYQFYLSDLSYLYSKDCQLIPSSSHDFNSILHGLALLAYYENDIEAYQAQDVAPNRPRELPPTYLHLSCDKSRLSNYENPSNFASDTWNDIKQSEFPDPFFRDFIICLKEKYSAT